MKRLLKTLRDWLIVKMGGMTQENAESILEQWDNDVHKLAILISERDFLKETNNRLSIENKRLEMELDRNPPAWKMLGTVETLHPKTIQAERTIYQDPETAVDMMKFVKDQLTMQILDGARPYICYQFKNDFSGNTRTRATLRILEGPAPIWGAGE